MKIKNVCCVCRTEFITARKSKTTCSDHCNKVLRTHKAFPENSEYVECKICKIRAKQLIQHIEKVHNMTIDEYCKKYNVTRHDLTIQSLHMQMKTNIAKACKEGRCGWQKGEKNPSHDIECKTGRRSVWSMNYHGYDGLSDKEKQHKIAELSNKVVEKMNDNHNNPLRLDYYTSRGKTIEEAKQLLSERQRTFSLEKCIEKYGKEEGTKIFKQRQNQWQNTLQSKPIEEIERINKAKMLNGKDIQTSVKNCLKLSIIK